MSVCKSNLTGSNSAGLIRERNRTTWLKHKLVLSCSWAIRAVLIAWFLLPPGDLSIAFAQSPLQLQIDAELAALWPILLKRELQHYAFYGKWFQGLATHGTIPADGARLFLDNWGGHPTDQTTNWSDFLDLDLPPDLPMALTLDVYEAPTGGGFVACVWVYAAGNLYTRCKGIGPEGRPRTTQWAIVT